jgi:hypothetical protein
VSDGSRSAAGISAADQPRRHLYQESYIMVDAYGFRPRGSYGLLAPFGFAPQAPQSPDVSSGGNGQGYDVSDVVPAQFRCQNVECGAHTGGVTYPLCQSCNDRLKNGGGPILLENGIKLIKPIRPGK